MSALEIIRATMSDFARLLGVQNDAAEDALKSDHAAKSVLTRRNFFAAAAALGTSAVISVPKPAQQCLIRLGEVEWAFDMGPALDSYVGAPQAFRIATLWI